MSKFPNPDSIDFVFANVSHLHRTRVHQLLESLGLYRGQPQLLRELWQEEGLTQTDLAARLQITPATVTKMLQRMEKAGFVWRKPDPEDQRVSRVYLTEAGWAVKSEVNAVFQRMEMETFANLGEEDHRQLLRYLLQLRDNLLQVTGEKPWE